MRFAPATKTGRLDPVALENTHRRLLCCNRGEAGGGGGAGGGGRGADPLDGVQAPGVCASGSRRADASCHAAATECLPHAGRPAAAAGALRNLGILFRWMNAPFDACMLCCAYPGNPVSSQQLDGSRATWQQICSQRLPEWWLGPTVSCVMQAWRSHEAVVAAVCNAYRHVMRSLRVRRLPAFSANTSRALLLPFH